MEAFQSGTFLRDESIVVSLRRQLLMASVPLALFELLAAAWPVYALMSFDKLDRSLPREWTQTFLKKQSIGAREA